MNDKEKRKPKTKYHDPPMKFNIALQKYIPDLHALGKLKEKLKKKK